MTSFQYLLSLTLNEYMTLRDTGSIPVARHRMIPVEMDDDGNMIFDDIKKHEVIDFLPAVGINDEHNLIFVLVRSSCDDMSTSNSLYRVMPKYIRPEITELLYLSVEKHMAATQRGSAILRGRIADGDIEFINPVLDKEISSHFDQAIMRNHLRGGYALSELLLSKCTIPDNEAMINEAIEGISAKGIGCEFPNKNMGLLANAILYQRHKFTSKSEMGFFTDLGVLIVELANKPKDEIMGLDALRAISQNSDMENMSYSDLLRHPSAIAALSKLAEDVDCVVPLISLITFMRWKHIIIKEQRVDTHWLKQNINELHELLNGDELCGAVWMTGCYVGFSEIATPYYASNRNRKTEDTEATAIPNGSENKDNIGRDDESVQNTYESSNDDEQFNAITEILKEQSQPCKLSQLVKVLKNKIGKNYKVKELETLILNRMSDKISVVMINRAKAVRFKK